MREHEPATVALEIQHRDPYEAMRIEILPGGLAEIEGIEEVARLLADLTGACGSVKLLTKLSYSPV
jgi:hypothetical protein